MLTLSRAAGFSVQAVQLAKRELQGLWRNKPGFVATYLVPTLLNLFFALIFFQVGPTPTATPTPTPILCSTSHPSPNPYPNPTPNSCPNPKSSPGQACRSGRVGRPRGPAAASKAQACSTALAPRLSQRRARPSPRRVPIPFTKTLRTTVVEREKAVDNVVHVEAARRARISQQQQLSSPGLTPRSGCPGHAHARRSRFSPFTVALGSRVAACGVARRPSASAAPRPTPTCACVQGGGLAGSVQSAEAPQTHQSARPRVQLCGAQEPSLHFGEISSVRLFVHTHFSFGARAHTHTTQARGPQRGAGGPGARPGAPRTLERAHTGSLSLAAGYPGPAPSARHRA